MGRVKLGLSSSKCLIRWSSRCAVSLAFDITTAHGVRQPGADCLAVGFMSVPCHSPMDTKPGRCEILWAITTCSWFSKALGDVGASYQMQSYMVILITYCIGVKKAIIHCWVLRFLLENGYKVACKKFLWSGQRGGIAPCPPLKYATGLYCLTDESNLVGAQEWVSE